MYLLNDCIIKIKGCSEQNAFIILIKSRLVRENRTLAASKTAAHRGGSHLCCVSSSLGILTKANTVNSRHKAKRNIATARRCAERTCVWYSRRMMTSPQFSRVCALWWNIKLCTSASVWGAIPICIVFCINAGKFMWMYKLLAVCSYRTAYICFLVVQFSLCITFFVLLALYENPTQL